MIACMTTSARELSARLTELLRTEHAAMADFLLALADFDQRRCWVDLGYPSLFAFLQRELRLSDGAAFYRQTAAYLVQRFPGVLEPLRDGRLGLTTVFELSKVMTNENVAVVLPRFFGVSKREAQEIVAEPKPEPAPERTLITPVRALPLPTADDRQVELGQAKYPDANSDAPPREVLLPPPTPAPRRIVEPKTADLTRLHVTVSRTLLKKLAAARDALSHSHPGASDSEVLEVALDLVLDRAAKRRGLVKKPRTEPPRSAPDSDGIPAHVRRAVWTRDGGRCQWPTADGGVCGSTYRVELDHVVPRALGGASTFENLRCACRRHNDRHAREVHGDAWMDRYTSNPGGTRVREPTVAYAVPATGGYRSFHAVFASQARIDARWKIPRAHIASRSGHASPFATSRWSIRARSASAGENVPPTNEAPGGSTFSAKRMSRSAAARASGPSGVTGSPTKNVEVGRAARSGARSLRRNAWTMRTRARARGSSG
jgi:hypothetical protein